MTKSTSLISDRYIYQGRTLGQGSYGKVELALDSETGELVAIKAIDKRALPRSVQQHVLLEIDALRELDGSSGIMSFRDAVVDEDTAYIITEYLPRGDLFEMITRDQPPAAHIRSLFAAVARAVMHCHDASIAHCDLKLDNILLDRHNKCKLIDFGYCHQVDKGQLVPFRCCGTPAYVAPEVLDRVPMLDPFAVDVWALGVILFTMLARRFPFHPEDMELLRKQATNTNYIKNMFRGPFPSLAKDLLLQMFKSDPLERASLADVLAHPWVADCDSQPDSF